MRIVLLLVLMTMAVPLAGQTLYAGQCKGSFAGVPLAGVLTVDRLLVHQTTQYRGVFYTLDGNRYDFEVNSNRTGGIGSAWRNGARHRETRIEMQMSGSSFAIADLDNGGRGNFSCQ